MSPRHEVLVYVISLLIIDTIPLQLPVTALVLLYVVLRRPEWFSKMYDQIYR